MKNILNSLRNHWPFYMVASCFIIFIFMIVKNSAKKSDATPQLIVMLNDMADLDTLGGVTISKNNNNKFMFGRVIVERKISMESWTGAVAKRYNDELGNLGWTPVGNSRFCKGGIYAEINDFGTFFDGRQVVIVSMLYDQNASIAKCEKLLHSKGRQE